MYVHVFMYYVYLLSMAVYRICSWGGGGGGGGGVQIEVSEILGGNANIQSWDETMGERGR